MEEDGKENCFENVAENRRKGKLSSYPDIFVNDVFNLPCIIQFIENFYQLCSCEANADPHIHPFPAF
jgi:hypothetical protein